MTNKKRVREYIEQDQIYQDWKSGKLIDLSDFDKFCIDNCKAIEELLNEVEELHNKIDKAIEYIEKCSLGEDYYGNPVMLAKEDEGKDLLEILKEGGVNE